MQTTTRTGTLRGTAYEAKFHDRCNDTPVDEVMAQLERNDRCTRIIISHFFFFPGDKINAVRLSEIYGEHDFHTYRSRLTELGDTKDNRGLLHQEPERVKLGPRRSEHPYTLSPLGHSLLFGSKQLDAFPAYSRAI